MIIFYVPGTSQSLFDSHEVHIIIITILQVKNCICTMDIGSCPSRKKLPALTWDSCLFAMVRNTKSLSVTQSRLSGWVIHESHSSRYHSFFRFWLFLVLCSKAYPKGRRKVWGMKNLLGYLSFTLKLGSFSYTFWELFLI